jgi:hypothetical protein
MMLTWQHFLEVRLGTFVESWVKQKQLIYIKESRSEFNDNPPYFNGFLRLESWDFACLLGLVDMNGIWDLVSYVNRP